MRIKKIFVSAVCILLSILLCSCSALGGTESGGGETPGEETHTCYLRKRAARQVTCTLDGNIEYYCCLGCNSYYLDADGKNKITYNETRIPKLEHKNMVHNEGFAPNVEADGEKEHYYCPDCNKYFLDENGEVETNAEDVVLNFYQPDFMVEIPTGRDPVVLHLTDTQIIDGAQARPDRSEDGKYIHATELIEEYCYDYVEETITQTNPDLIIITGDLVYGKYDDNGSVFLAFINFMESFEIPWAPVFGNHDNESKMGADWQCQQLENAEYCLFEQKDLTGNGNYTVGIMQDNQLLRVFFMLDSNGCGGASSESLANGHTTRSVGFGDDQISWYKKEIENLKASMPNTKISFAFHIQLQAFADAFAKYGYDGSVTTQNIWVTTHANRTEGDFGYIGRKAKDPFDTNGKIFEYLKNAGVDSIYVGHEHCNSVSVVYQGVRLQYGQKSSAYDRVPSVKTDGTLSVWYVYGKSGTPLIGGTVIMLSATDGAIKNTSVFYCENAGGKLNWDSILSK